MKITKEWLEQQGACKEGKRWFLSQKATRVETVIKKLITQERFEWGNWTLTRLMSHEQNVRYACFAAYKSLEEFERVYPADKRPREAVEAALKWANEPTEENRSAAEAAGSATEAAGSAAWAAWSAAWAAWAAGSARSAAWAEWAAWAARSAAWAGSAAETAEAAGSAGSAESAVWKIILSFGLKLLLSKLVRVTHR